MQNLSPLNEISDSLTRARSAPTKSYGITFTKAKREEKNYQSLMSPGPIYAGYDVHNNILHKSVSVPKSKRVSVFDEIPLLNVSPGPAAPYNPAAPKSKAIVSFPKTKRFIDEELRHRDSKLTPGPGYYTSSLTESTMHNESPSFTFGLKKENDKRYFSDEMDFKGPMSVSPGPVYDVDETFQKLEEGPKISFPKGPRKTIYTSVVSLYEPVMDQKPSPGDHEIQSSIGREAPAYSFGSSHRTGPPIVDTPGPKYHPDVSNIKDRHVNVIFGRTDRANLSTPKRFISDKMAQAENYGLHSPGPAFYNPKKLDFTPGVFLIGKEKEVTESVYPQARRPRFLSKELSSENQGQWSPGPKYVPPSTLAGPKFSFGVSDDHTKTRSNAPRDAYEKMIHGPYIRPNTKMNTPGPKYNVRTEPTSDVKTYTIPKSKRKSEMAKIDGVPGPGQYGSPDLKTVGKVSNSMDFNSMGKPRNKKIDRVDFGSLGKDSPGPMYKLDLSSLSKGTKKSATWGGLS